LRRSPITPGVSIFSFSISEFGALSSHLSFSLITRIFFPSSLTGELLQISISEENPFGQLLYLFLLLFFVFFHQIAALPMRAFLLKLFKSVSLFCGEKKT